ncbi:MAG: 5'/3'-nucleotidase SurE [Anaerolineae bacterium]|nr:5'/3'-nucleotidase SurE [Anaerolineae bacterium]
MSESKELILVTNDDGITSPGLRAAVRAAAVLGEPFVVAPRRQWSGAGRSMPPGVGWEVQPYPFELDGRAVTAYQIEGTPAMAVARALLELVPRPPALLISGVNYGENLGSDVTISGTVGAALQGAVLGLPAMAVSLQTPKEMHNAPSDAVDFTAAIHFTCLFGRRILDGPLPFDVDVLKIDLPADATPGTPWRLTRLSRYPYFVPVLAPPDQQERRIAADYSPVAQIERTERDSDIYALAVDRVVSVTPLSLDLTSRADMSELEVALRGAGPLPGRW